MHSVKIRALQEVMPSVYLLTTSPLPRAAPGQFFMFRCGEGAFLRRPLAVHRQDAESTRFLFRVVGRGTRWLASRRPGDELEAMGPLGKGFSLPSRPESLLLIAGGTGIAPLLFLAEAATEAGHRVSLLLGAATASELYPADLLPRGLRTLRATEDGSMGTRGKVTELLASVSAPFARVYAAGPVEMYRELKQRSELQGVPIEVTLEVRMACGFGACLGCSIPTGPGNKLVCRDGPVFDLGELDLSGITLLPHPPRGAG